MSVQSLPSVLDTSAATPLHAELVGLIDQLRPIALDGAAVGRVGLACLQVLAAARSTALDRGLGFSLSDPSTPLAEMASLARLDVIFDRVG